MFRPSRVASIIGFAAALLWAVPPGFAQTRTPLPPAKPSHRESGVQWYGPYQHFGERAQQFEAAELPIEADHQAWFYTFMEKAKIDFDGKYVDPDPQMVLLS